MKEKKTAQICIAISDNPRYEEDLKRAVEAAEAQGYKVKTPLEIYNAMGEADKIHYTKILLECIKSLASPEVDTLFVYTTWFNNLSKGQQAEIAFAEAIKKQIVYKYH